MNRPTALQAWSPFIGACALAAMLVVLRAGGIDGGFVDRWLWHPITQDLGYNPVNTTLLVVLSVAGLAWLYLLFQHYGEPVDAATGIGGLLFFTWGVTLRLFEDSDLFTPFDRTLVAAGGAAGSACMPDPTGFTDCAGVLFITPLLWLWLAVLLFVFGRAGLHVQWLHARDPQRARIHAVAWIGLLALVHVVWWLLRPAWAAAAPRPWLVSAAAGVVAAVLWRRSEPRWSDLLIASPIVCLAGSLDLMLQWFDGGRGDWQPVAVRPWMLWILVGLIALVAATRVLVANRLAATPETPPEDPGQAVAWQLYLDLLAAAVVFVAAASLTRRMEGDGTGGWVIVLVLLPLLVVAAQAVARQHADARLAAFVSPIAVLMLIGQATDALVTAIGLDVLGGGEKHFVPRALIGLVDGLGLPAPLGTHPTAIVLIGYKIPLVVLATWVLAVRGRDWPPALQDARMLVMLCVGFIGFVPGVRNALRMAMGI